MCSFLLLVYRLLGKNGVDLGDVGAGWGNKTKKVLFK